MSREILMLTFTLIAKLALAAMVTVVVTDVASAQGGNIYQATLAEPNQKDSGSQHGGAPAHLGRRQRHRPGFPETLGIRGRPHSGRTER